MATWTREELTKQVPKGVPIWARSNGSWTYKAKGKVHSLGGWGEGKTKAEQTRLMKAAIVRYRQLTTPGTEPAGPDELTLGELCERFIRDKRRASKTHGKPAPKRIDRLQHVCDFLCDQLGKRQVVAEIMPDDWTEVAYAIAERWRKTSSQHGIRVDCRCILTYAFEQRWISVPMRYGKNFGSLQSRVDLERDASRSTNRDYFKGDEIRKQLDHAKSRFMRAGILIAANCGMTVGDICEVRFDYFKPDGWYEGPRQKSGVMRRAKLWRPTLSALEDYRRNERIKLLPDSPDEEYLFTSTHRKRISNGVFLAEFSALLERCGQSELGISTKGYRKFAGNYGNLVHKDATKRVLGHKMPEIILQHYAHDLDPLIENVCESLEKQVFPDE